MHLNILSCGWLFGINIAFLHYSFLNSLLFIHSEPSVGVLGNRLFNFVETPIHKHFEKLAEKFWKLSSKTSMLESSLKVVSAIFLLVCFVCLKESTGETRKNVFYFTSKALYILAR